MSTAAAVAIPSRGRLWTALLAVYVLWGSSYVAILVMVRAAPPLLSGGVRFLIAGLALLVFLGLRPGGLARLRIPGVEARGLLLAAAALAASNALINVAEQDVPSSLAALINASVPFWVIILRRTVGGERIGRATTLSVAVGFAGVALLLLPGSSPAGASFLGAALVLAAAVTWAAFSYAGPRLSLPADLLLSAGSQMALAGLLLLVAGLLAGEGAGVDLGSTSGDAWIAFVWLVVASSGLGFTAYVWLLQNAPVSQVATYAYVNPVVAVLLAWVLLAEHLSATTLAATALIAVSVAVTVGRESPPRRRKGAAALTPPPAPAGATPQAADPAGLRP